MRLFPNFVLKHEGNMPFENDGLRACLINMTHHALNNMYNRNRNRNRNP